MELSKLLFANSTLGLIRNHVEEFSSEAQMEDTFKALERAKLKIILEVKRRGKSCNESFDDWKIVLCNQDTINTLTKIDILDWKNILERSWHSDPSLRLKKS